MERSVNWIPSRKWFAALISGVATIVLHALASGGWDTTEWGELVTLASGLALAYLVPNGSDSPPAQVHTLSTKR